MIFDIEIYTNIGKRKENQDSLRYEILNESSLVSCIADGVGGRIGGSIASNEAVNEFTNEVQKKYGKIEINLNNLINSIHKNIISTCDENNLGMATTFTGIIIDNFKLKGVHTGDTRTCILRGNGIKQLTINHTEIGRLIREGLIDVKDAKNYPRRNMIESALGITDRELETYEFDFDLEIGDRIILTTDGVHETITKKEFRDISIITKTSKDFLTKLIDLLEIREPKDNNSIVVISIN